VCVLAAWHWKAPPESSFSAVFVSIFKRPLHHLWSAVAAVAAGYISKSQSRPYRPRMAVARAQTGKPGPNSGHAACSVWHFLIASSCGTM
ncbi:hypothetical protein JMJ77_0011428, partial [Colletotrichum scovillei]